MIIKGASRATGAALGAYLTQSAKNERAEVLEVRGTVANDPRGALIEMEAVAAGTRCEKPIYHGIISPAPTYRLTREQCFEAVDALEQKLGLDGQPRVIVLHEHEGREHLHVAWGRVDRVAMTAIPDSFNYVRHEQVARDLERRFGHDRVQGAHAERDGPDGRIARPERTPSRFEQAQEDRTGIRGKEVRAEVTQAFRASDSAEAFKAALAQRGYILAKGDRRDFVIVDETGGIHSLARRVDGINAAQLRVFMTSIDREALPSAAEARDRRSLARGDQPFDRDAANRTGGDQAWEDRVAGAGIEDARKQEASEAERRSDNLQLRAADRADNVTLRDRDGEAFWKDYAARRDQAALARMEHWQASAKTSRADTRRAGGQHEDHAAPLESGGLRVIDAATNMVGKLADFVADLLIGVGPAPPNGSERNGPENGPEQIVAERRANAALQRIERHIERNEPLRSEDVRALLPSQLDQIRAGGDDYIYATIGRSLNGRPRDDILGRERDR